MFDSLQTPSSTIRSSIYIEIVGSPSRRHSKCRCVSTPTRGIAVYASVPLWGLRIWRERPAIAMGAASRPNGLLSATPIANAAPHHAALSQSCERREENRNRLLPVRAGTPIGNLLHSILPIGCSHLPSSRREGRKIRFAPSLCRMATCGHLPPVWGPWRVRTARGFLPP